MGLFIQANIYLACYSVWTDESKDESMQRWVSDQMKRIEHLAVGSKMYDENMVDRAGHGRHRGYQSRLRADVCTTWRDRDWLRPQQHRGAGHGRDCTQRSAGDGLCAPIHLTKPAEVQRYVDYAAAEHGRIDVLLNAAAIQPHMAKMADVDYDCEWIPTILGEVDIVVLACKPLGPTC